MENNHDQQNLNVTEETNYVDPRTVSAEVIGELRKDKIGKPILVVEMFVLFAIVLIALPIVNSMLNDDQSVLYKLLYGDTSNIIVPNDPVIKDEFLDASKEQPLAIDTKMRLNNIIMETFTLSGNAINCKMYSYNGLINLDKEEYYLEVYSNSKNLLSTIKLTGSFDNQEQDIVLTNDKLSFNEKYSYFAKIVVMNEDDYPAVTITSDESGIGSLTCSKDKRSIEYVFKNNYLIGIKDTDKVGLTDGTTEDYINSKKIYDEKSTLLTGVSKVEEVSDGFVFTANLDLENYKVPEKLVDYNYYPLDTEAKKIDYALKGKGFDCK